MLVGRTVVTEQGRVSDAPPCGAWMRISTWYREQACEEPGHPLGLLSGVRVVATTAALVAVACLLVSTTALAQATGETIINPTTGGEETIIATFPGAVITDQNNVIAIGLLQVGSMVFDPAADPSDPEAPLLTITELVTNPATGLVDMVNATNGGEPPVITMIPIVSDASSEVDSLNNQAGSGVLPGDTGGDYALPAATGDENTVRDARFGSNGGGGRNGGGVEICVPFVGCATLGVDAQPGSPGGSGPTISQTTGPVVIETVSPSSPGVIVSSQGGRGGSGGNGFGVGTPGANGGAGGDGGAVDVLISDNTTISTNGDFAHGALIQSRGGAGGVAGDGYIASGGGDGGPAGNGFSATATNDGAISTQGAGAIGMLVQSLGGTAGDGGSSFGIVGFGGGSDLGGDGGAAAATNRGTITTADEAAHGILAQSIGGSGGDAGDAGGLWASAANGEVGGNGGTAEAINSGADALIQTTGVGSFGLFAQSVGGGGGNGGTAGGVVALGSAGAGGGTGGTAGVINRNGGTIITTNVGSVGMFAQSVGGGGGNGGTGGGLVSLGGDGSVGGNGGDVSALNGAGSAITTGGDGAYGIFVQSVGGGGGNGGVGGALVALGGSGSGGGVGGRVTVTTEAGGSIATGGESAHGIFAQSVGGGGGAGATGGGVVALGGSAGGAGNAGDVTVTSENVITTSGVDARGIFAQSVGGGGGSANGSGGLVSLGGTGGSGGAGGIVTVTNAGGIGTTSSGADAIYAQSVGEGGGSGASSGGLVSLGGSGASGGAGGAVSITNSGLLSTAEARARGIFAQSVGGGGGSGGESGGLVAIGGAGSATSNGGTVSIDNSGAISTSGNVSSAIHAQSIGGGGGDGGTSGGLFTLGGSGGGGGAAGTVTVGHSGSITTGGDDSHGLFAQAVGGGGGNGGNAASGSLFLGVAIGGEGDGGGAGAATNINFTNQDVTLMGVTQSVSPFIETTGDRSNGVLAQSVGGGGGNGGFAIQATAGYIASVSVAVGGSAGGGGTGGAVNLNGDVRVQTDGLNSDGILAQSVGGGGGNGGLATSVSLAAGETAAFSVSTGVGGTGGSGGDGGAVTLRSGGTLLTQGALSEGLIAQSVGGGGGNGGFSVSVSGAGAGAASGAVAVGVGGTGGDGGAGNAVDVEYAGAIMTEGLNSDAVLIQSVGGSGGNGGFNVSGSVNGGAAQSGAVAVGVGGSGGGGGTAGTARSVLTADVMTLGEGSDAVIVQSVGGSGGNGGFNVTGSVTSAGQSGGAASVGVGGSGAGAGAGNTVTSMLTGNVTTAGLSAGGVLAQSVGGSGGNGAFNVSGSIAAGTAGAGAASVGVGGAGGGGGSGGLVTSGIVGNITTMGDRSDAFVSQSLGGGGGNGSFNVSGTISASATGAGSVSVGVGGSGGGGGNGAAVEASMTGDTTTTGEEANAIIVQSVGGGGGNGAFNVAGSLALSGSTAGTIGVGVGGFGGLGGNSGAVTSNMEGNVSTLGAGAQGLLVQSVAGGGGNGAFNVEAGLSMSTTGSAGNLGVGIGGFGGDGGSSGAVVSNFSGSMVTAGSNADAVVLQSLGGGGGNGGINVTGAVSLSGATSGSIGVGIGGFGGGGGEASTVHGSIDGLVATSGADSGGVLAQSLGGGGGNGGINVSGALSFASSGSIGASIGIGGAGGLGGDSGNATLVRDGRTETTGPNSDAVVIQSLAGGGGNGSINVSGGITGAASGTSATSTIGIGGFGGSGGAAGNVSGTVSGDVVALGSGLETFFVVDGLSQRLREGGSNGIIAQSVGGSGGNGALNVSGGIALNATPGSGHGLNLGIGGFGGSGGNAGTVDLNVVSGDVVAFGDKKSAVFAQSLGGGGGNGSVNITGGISTGGSLAVGIGGFGGDGGSGRDVTATAEAALWARGENARGFVAQSVGGGGGNGGLNISGGIGATTGAPTPSLVYGMGGFGGAANVSGNVDATQTGSVNVTGTDTIGVLAQSVAGGGGSGGLNVSGSLTAGTGFNVAVGIGGFAGAGADAGDVSLVSNGQIRVDGRREFDPEADPESQLRAETELGERGRGILAQSIGGGGGVGGINATGIGSPSGNPIAVGVGGYGGAGGNAGTVSVVRGEPGTANLLETLGNQSNGLTAQSIGGGGGDAGMNFVLTTSGVGAATPVELILGVGGEGGASGNAAATSVNHIGTIITRGAQSDGLVAQSIGGGGGNANFNLGVGYNRHAVGLNIVVGGGTGDGGTGGAVNVDHAGMILTEGDDSSAIVAQSIGGGGGDTATNYVRNQGSTAALNIGVGRLGGTGGAAGNVTVASNGDLSTAGARSTALLAQSVGNGGGRSGTVKAGVSASSGTGETKEKAKATVKVGLDGGAGGTGAEVQVDAQGSIVTTGEESHAIHAQSIGGGGGIGGSATLMFTKADVSAGVGVGGTGGTGGVSGAVRVDTSAAIVTTGINSHGILAQSIGGGGGTAGHSGSVTFQPGQATGGSNNTVAVSVGGVGGEGANASSVNVTNTGTVTTTAEGSFGISAESIGGGGGEGGMIMSGTLGGLGSRTAIEVGVGGSGGTGGIGGQVDVTNHGRVHTVGARAIGVRAQSIGGGGGDAGTITNFSISAAGSTGSASRAVVNVGGKGGTGGRAGNVTVANGEQIILTEGEDAHGIFAQSIGGGGGNGSSIVTTMFSGGLNSTLAGVNIGGAGGTGNSGGDVTVSNAGLIDTMGDGAHGVYAQSIGGGGGNGGLAVATNAVLSTAGGTPLVVVGGSGGDGDEAGHVVVNNTGRIQTRGTDAHGIYAQSIGGGGGNGSLGIGAGLSLGTSNLAFTTLLANTLSAVVGSSGGSGGLGGTVTVNHSGDITVLGEGSQAIKAESINGGGGGIELDFSEIATIPIGQVLPEIPLPDQVLPEIPLPDVPDTITIADAPVLTVLAGGNEVMNSDAGAVTLNVEGTFGVVGDNGSGASMQSIGGGGGTMQATVSFDDDATSPDPLEVIAILGGTDGINNAGGNITGSHAGDIITLGRNTPGLSIQSIGGGGGSANISLLTPFEEIGAIDLALGGSGGTDEAGGNILHTQTGAIATEGDQAFGVIAQSVGGGGGRINFFIGQEPTRAPLSEPETASSRVRTAGSRASMPSDFSLGATGGTGLDGGDVSMTLTGEVMTSGDGALGLFYQSVGAGGGQLNLSGVDPATLMLGGQGGAQGNGGDVTINQNGDVTTLGYRAHGIFLQSVGGGGGAAFTSTGSPIVTLSADNDGDGGSVSLSAVGDIHVLGDESLGVIVQSAGGGGGFVDGGFRGTAGGAGAGGAVSFDGLGNITADGAGSTAVFAQSVGGDGGGNISLTLDGVIKGGSGDPAQAAAIALAGGGVNTISIGANSFVFALSDQAITATAGDDAVTSSGFVLGNVDLGAGTNTFTNTTAGSLRSLGRLNLGPSGLLTNEGTWVPGGAIIDPSTPVGGEFDAGSFSLTNHRAQTTDLEGSVELTGTSHFLIDAAYRVTGAAGDGGDLITATGSAEIGGLVTPTLLALERALPLTIIDPGLSSANNGAAVTDTVVIAYSIGVDGATGDGTTIDLIATPDFSIDGMTRNQAAAGDHINDVLNGDGSQSLGALFAYIGNQTDANVVVDAIDRVAGEGYAANVVDALFAVDAFVDAMMNCERLTPLQVDAAEGTCYWLQEGWRHYDRDESFQFQPFRSNAYRVAGGFQMPIEEYWRAGLAIAYERMDIDVGDRFDSRGSRVQFGGALRYQRDGLEVDFGLGGGVSFYDVDRIVAIEGLIAEDLPFAAGRATNSHTAAHADLRLGASLALETESKRFYALPEIDLDATFLQLGEGQERGLGAVGIELEDRNSWVLTAFAGAEAGARFTLGESFELRPYIRSGVQVRNVDEISVDLSLIGSPESAGPFRSYVGFDQVVGEAGAGLVAESDSGFSAQLGYDGAFGSTSTQHQATIRLELKF